MPKSVEKFGFFFLYLCFVCSSMSDLVGLNKLCFLWIYAALINVCIFFYQIDHRENLGFSINIYSVTRVIHTLENNTIDHLHALRQGLPIGFTFSIDF